MEQERTTVFASAITMLKMHQLLPKPKEKYFKLKFVVVVIPLFTVFLFTTTMQIWYMTRIRKFVVHNVLVENIAMFASISGAFQILRCIYVKKRDVQKLLRELEDFADFGTPGGVPELSRNLSRIVNLSVLYGFSASATYFLNSRLHKSYCEEINAKYDMENICGMFIIAWFPFSVEAPLVKWILNFLMFLNGACIINMSLVYEALIGAAFWVMILKIKHLRELLVEAFARDNEECERRLNVCLEYHEHILKLSDKMNFCFSSVALMHMLWTALVIGIAGYQFVVNKSLSGIIHLIGWGSNCIILSYVGQKIIDASWELRKEMFYLSWYDKNVAIQKKILFALMRMDKPMCLKVMGIGVMNSDMFGSIVKSGYQFLTLINQTLD